MLRKSNIALRIYRSEKEKAVALAAHHGIKSLSDLMRYLLNKEFEQVFGETEHGIDADDEKYDIHKGSYFFKNRDRFVSFASRERMPERVLEFAYYFRIADKEEGRREHEILQLAITRMEKENLWNDEVNYETVAKKAGVTLNYFMINFINHLKTNQPDMVDQADKSVLAKLRGDTSKI